MVQSYFARDLIDGIHVDSVGNEFLHPLKVSLFASQNQPHTALLIASGEALSKFQLVLQGDDEAYFFITVTKYFLIDEQLFTFYTFHL